MFRKRVGDYYLGRTLGEVRGEAKEGETREKDLGLRRCLFFFRSLDLNLTLFLLLSPSRINNNKHQGTYAKVKYGRHVETGEEVAVKIMRKDRVLGPDAAKAKAPTTAATKKPAGGDGDNDGITPTSTPTSAPPPNSPALPPPLPPHP